MRASKSAACIATFFIRFSVERDGDSQLKGKSRRDKDIKVAKTLRNQKAKNRNSGAGRAVHSQTWP